MCPERFSLAFIRLPSLEAFSDFVHHAIEVRNRALFTPGIPDADLYAEHEVSLLLACKDLWLAWNMLSWFAAAQRNTH